MYNTPHRFQSPPRIQRGPRVGRGYRGTGTRLDFNASPLTIGEPTPLPPTPPPSPVAGPQPPPAVPDAELAQRMKLQKATCHLQKCAVEAEKAFVEAEKVFGDAIVTGAALLAASHALELLLAQQLAQQ